MHAKLLCTRISVTTNSGAKSFTACKSSNVTTVRQRPAEWHLPSAHTHRTCARLLRSRFPSIRSVHHGTTRQNGHISVCARACWVAPTVAGVRHNLCTMPNSWCTMRTLSTAAGTRSPATRAQFGIFVVARSIRLNCAPTYRVPIDGLHRFACVLYLTTHRRAVCFRRHGRTCWCMRSWRAIPSGRAKCCACRLYRFVQLTHSYWLWARLLRRWKCASSVSTTVRGCRWARACNSAHRHSTVVVGQYHTSRR